MTILVKNHAKIIQSHVLTNDNMNRKQRIEKTISAQLTLQHIFIEDESGHHSVPKGSESHFKVILVSDEFVSLNRVKRHRLINHLLKEEFSQGLHALSLHLYTPEEWKRIHQDSLKSPDCLGGSRHG